MSDVFDYWMAIAYIAVRIVLLGSLAVCAVIILVAGPIVGLLGFDANEALGPALVFFGILAAGALFAHLAVVFGSWIIVGLVRVSRAFFKARRPAASVTDRID